MYYTKDDSKIYIVELNDVESNYDFIHIKKQVQTELENL